MTLSGGNRAAVVLLAVFLFLPGACSKKIHRVSRPLLGTIINLTFIAEDHEAPGAAEAVFDEIARIEKLMSPYRTGSDIDRLNRFAHQRPVIVSEETFRLVEQSAAISKASGGAFDITFAAMIRFYKNGEGSFKPPSEGALREALKLVDYRHLVLDSSKRSIFYKHRGVRISLGAIAKGYAVRRGIEILKSRGVTSAIVEEGGDLQVAGTRYGTPWRTGIRHPRENDLMGAFNMQSGESIATSGDYERFTSHRGKKYHHIIDPRTGRPTETFASVSVIADDPVAADAWATALFVMGLDEGMKLLKKRSDLQVVLVGLDGRVHVSSSLKKRLTFFKPLKVEWL